MTTETERAAFDAALDEWESHDGWQFAERSATLRYFFQAGRASIPAIPADEARAVLAESLAVLEKFRRDYDTEGFGCACEPGRLCGPCEWDKRHLPVYAVIASLRRALAAPAAKDKDADGVKEVPRG